MGHIVWGIGLRDRLKTHKSTHYMHCPALCSSNGRLGINKQNRFRQNNDNNNNNNNKWRVHQQAACSIKLH